jgi:hypothetical protein
MYFAASGNGNYNNLSFIGSVHTDNVPISIITVQLTNTANNNSIFQLNQANSYLSFKDFIFSLNYTSSSTWFLFHTTQLTPRFMLENCHFNPTDTSMLDKINCYIIRLNTGLIFVFFIYFFFSFFYFILLVC